MSTKDIYQDRSIVIRITILIAASLLILKAAQIQLFDHSYQNRAESTTIEKNIIYPSRGLIYDRNSKLLVNNKAMYDLMVTYRQINPNMDTQKFCKLLGIDTTTFRQNLDKDWKSGRFSKSIPFE